MTLSSLYCLIWSQANHAICIKVTNQQSSFVLTVTCTHSLSHPLGSSGECTLTVKRKLADWTGNFLFDSACLFSWTWLTSVDLSPRAQQSAARALPRTHSHTPAKQNLLHCFTTHRNGSIIQTVPFLRHWEGTFAHQIDWYSEKLEWNLCDCWWLCECILWSQEIH